MTISLISGPAAAALSDAFANPTASAIFALKGVWNGTTWDREVSANSATGTSGTGIPASGTMIYDGTNWHRAGGIQGDSGQNAQFVAGNRKEVSFTTTTAQPVASTDVSNYRWVSVQITSQGTNSTVTFQGSNDNTNWVALTLAGTNTNNAPATNTTSAAMYHGPIGCRYFRLNVAGITAGTTQGVIEFFGVSAVHTTQSANLISTTPLADNVANTNASVQPQLYNGGTYDRLVSATQGAATTGKGILAAGALGIYNSSPPTVTSGNYERVQLDSSANLKVNTGVFSYNHISTNATTTVKASAGQLHCINVNNAGSAWTLTIYDNTAGSGTIIGVMSASQGMHLYDVGFSTGLTIVSSGTTAGDITVAYH